MPTIQTDAGPREISEEEFERLNARLPFTPGGDMGTDVLSIGQSLPGISFGTTAARQAILRVVKVGKESEAMKLLTDSELDIFLRQGVGGAIPKDRLIRIFFQEEWAKLLKEGTDVSKLADSLFDIAATGAPAVKSAVKAGANTDDIIKAAIRGGKILKVDIPADVLAANRIDTANLADLGFNAGRSSILNQLDDLEKFILNSGQVPQIKEQVASAATAQGATIISKLKNPRTAFLLLAILGAHSIGVQQASEVHEGRAFNARELTDAVIFQDMDPDVALKMIEEQKGDVYQVITEALVNSGMLNPLSVLTTFPGAKAKVELAKTTTDIAEQQIMAKKALPQDEGSFERGREFDLGQQSARNESVIKNESAMSQAVGEHRRNREIELFGALGTQDARVNPEIKGLRAQEQLSQIRINAENIRKKDERAGSDPFGMNISDEERKKMQSLPRVLQSVAPQQLTAEEIAAKASLPRKKKVL